jgi:hypothetical protein
MSDEPTPSGSGPEPAASEPAASEPPAQGGGTGAVEAFASGPPGEGRRGGGRLWLIAAGVVVALGIGAGAFAFIMLRGTGEVLVGMAPSDSTAYVTAYLDPSASQKLHLRSLVHKFPAVRTDEQLRMFIDKAVDTALSDSGLAFERDVRPWLGSQIAEVVRIEGGRTQMAVLIKSKNDGAALAALAKIRQGPRGSSQSWSEANHGGVTVSVGHSSSGGSEEQAYALIDHAFVAANSEALLEDIIDTDQGKRANLNSSAAYTKIRDALPSNTLGIAFVSAQPLIREFAGPLLAAGAPEVPSALAQLKAFTGVGFSVSAESNGIAADFTIGIDRARLTTDQQQALAVSTHQSTVLTSIPKDAYGLITFTGLTQGLESSVNQAARDPSARQALDDLGLTGPGGVIAHLTGDGGLEAGPGPTIFPAGAILVGTNDEPGMQRFLDRAADMALQGIAREQLASVAPLGTSSTGSLSALPDFQVQKQTYRGVTISYVPVPELGSYGVAPAYAVSGGMAILASSPEEVKAVLDAHAGGGNVTAAANFRDATGMRIRNSGMMYLDVEAIAAAIRETLPAFDQQDYDAHVAPNLMPVKAFLLTQQNGSDQISSRIFVLIR